MRHRDTLLEQRFALLQAPAGFGKNAVPSADVRGDPSPSECPSMKSDEPNAPASTCPCWSTAPLGPRSFLLHMPLSSLQRKITNAYVTPRGGRLPAVLEVRVGRMAAFDRCIG